MIYNCIITSGMHIWFIVCVYVCSKKCIVFHLIGMYSKRFYHIGIYFRVLYVLFPLCITAFHNIFCMICCSLLLYEIVFDFGLWNCIILYSILYIFKFYIGMWIRVSYKYFLQMYLFVIILIYRISIHMNFRYNILLSKRLCIAWMIFP